MASITTTTTTITLANHQYGGDEPVITQDGPELCGGRVLSKALEKKVATLHEIMKKAACTNNTRAAEAALKHGLHPHAEIQLNCGCCTYGYIHCAAKHGALDVVNVLVQAGVDINAVCTNKQSVLHWASKSFDEENIPLVSWLVEHGADLYAEDGHGNTAYDKVQTEWGAVKYCDDHHWNIIRMLSLLKPHLKILDGSIKPVRDHCAICLGEEKNDWCQLPCCNKFIHVGCIQQWWEHDHSCPLCRATLRSVTKVSKLEIELKALQPSFWSKK